MSLQVVSYIIRTVFCVAAGEFGALALGFQGNGNVIPSGIWIGLLLGSTGSWLLLFGVRSLIRSYPEARQRRINWFSFGVTVALPVITVRRI